MLQDIGFEYTWEVDPFDGGPHYRAKVSDIMPIKNLKQYNIVQVDQSPENSSIYFGTIPLAEHKFCSTYFNVLEKSADTLKVSSQHLKNLDLPKEFKSNCISI
jgi:arginine N-succinyltransferase